MGVLTVEDADVMYYYHSHYKSVHKYPSNLTKQLFEEANGGADSMNIVLEDK